MKKRIQSGIEGIDKMIYSGIPEGSQIMLAGGPGTGKTLFTFEFLYRGAQKGEIGLFFSFEESINDIVDNAKGAFSEFKDIDKLIDEKKLILQGLGETKPYMQKDVDGSQYTFGRMITEIESMIESTKATRLVLDSISPMKLFVKDPFEYRSISMDLVAVLRRLGMTSIVTIEIETPEKRRLLFQPEFFLYDGLIIMYTSGNVSEISTPTLEILKIRGSEHSRATVPYNITKNGIELLLMHEEKV